MFCNPHSATCGLRDAGTQNSTNLIQLDLQPAIPHFAGCGVRVDTNQTKIIGTLQPAFHTLRDVGFGLIKINIYTNSPAPRICGMRDAGLKMKYQMKGLPHFVSYGFAGCGMLKQSKLKFIILHSKFGLMCHNDMGSCCTYHKTSHSHARCHSI